MNALALPFLVFPTLASAQVPTAWVGSWYSETKEDKVFNGKNYDLRRELMVMREDGTKTAQWRYYSGAQLVGQFTATYAWGVKSDVFWIECRTLLLTNSAEPCSFRIEYDVVSTTSREIRYRSRKSGAIYTIQRVNDEFKLP